MIDPTDSKQSTKGSTRSRQCSCLLRSEIKDVRTRYLPSFFKLNLGNIRAPGSSVMPVVVKFEKIQTPAPFKLFQVSQGEIGYPLEPLQKRKKKKEKSHTVDGSAIQGIMISSSCHDN